MNKYIISIFDECMEHEDHEKIIALYSNKTVLEIKSELIKALEVSIDKYKALNQALNIASNNFSENVDIDDDETVTPYHEALEKAMSEKETFENNQNFLELHSTKINLADFLFNEESVKTFDVMELEDWFEKKRNP